MLKILFFAKAFTHNNTFKDLPIIPIKGDVLDISLKDIQLPPGLYYKKRWLHSLEAEGQHLLYRLGASYDVGNSDTKPSTSAKEGLIETLKAMLGS